MCIFLNSFFLHLCYSVNQRHFSRASSQDKDAVRAAAFTLFGKLSRFGDGPSKAPFLEQVHTNFISVLLHLNEESEVAKVSFLELKTGDSAV